MLKKCLVFFFKIKIKLEFILEELRIKTNELGEHQYVIRKSRKL